MLVCYFRIHDINIYVKSTGGPYFEILSQMCKDIQSSPLALFIPCPNAQIATEQEGSVTNRDKVFYYESFFVLSNQLF